MHQRQKNTFRDNGRQTTQQGRQSDPFFVPMPIALAILASVALFSAYHIWNEAIAPALDAATRAIEDTVPKPSKSLLERYNDIGCPTYKQSLDRLKGIEHKPNC